MNIEAPAALVTAVELMKWVVEESAGLFLARLPEGSLVAGRLWPALAVGGAVVGDVVVEVDGKGTGAVDMSFPDSCSAVGILGSRSG